MKKHIITLLFLFYSIALFSQISIDDTASATDLVQLLFNNSGCATISNFQVSGNNSYASFNKNGSSFPFENGIVLSTGFSANTIGPNNTLSDDNLGTSTDSDLAAIFSDTYDTTVLEFDFVPLTNYMSFTYLFASEEYQEGSSSTCNYSDVFAFLIKSSSDTNYTNIALVPNTTIPVQVTTVHPEIYNACQAENETYFGSWNSQTDPTIPINYNGQTAVLKAESIVTVGLTYHIKLIIADHSNYRYDSAVFLEAGSFTVGTNLGTDLLRSTKNPLCGTATTILDCGIASANSYKWFKDSVPYDDNFVEITGEINQTYTVTSEGKYKVAVDLGGGCVSEGVIVIEYDISPTVVNTQLQSCNDDESDFSVFDLSDANQTITNNDTNLIIEGYYKTWEKAVNTDNSITNYDNYTNQSLNEEIFVRVENQNGCFSIAKILLNVYHNPKIKDDASVFYCLNTYPQKITLDSGLLSNSNGIMYNWFFDNGTESINLNINNPNIEVNESGTYSIEITNADNCSVSREIKVTNSNTAIITNIIVAASIYPNSINIKIEVEGEGDYMYTVDDANFQDSPIFNNLSYGYHLITVKDKNGCNPDTQKEITFLNYPKFFTPNGDRINDYWNLIRTDSLLLHYQAISNISIYNRFGKIVAIINPNSIGWNGYYNGKLATPQDFWFRVELIDFNNQITTKTGHFSLVIKKINYTCLFFASILNVACGTNSNRFF